jgi:primosomal protein N' (replication factor Y)
MFSPIFNLGLIIIDEFHDASYKQDSTPKYNSILTGAMLTKLNPNSKLILGSATPNVADYHNLTTKQALLLEMGTRHNQTKQVSIIDSRQADNFSKSKIISEELYQSIKLKLSNLEQSLIFHNRRGSSRLQVCSTCDWVNNCPNCHIPLVFHADEYSLRCHTCGFKTKPELICPVCSSATLSLRGYGTKQIVSELEKLFPEARIIRFDADNTKKESTLAYNFEELQQGKFDIIVGTQILAKGLDLPKLSLVGILQAESGLTMPDFRSSERTFQLITQVIGRVGRGHLPGQVIIQTLAPNHPAITLAAKEDYTEFYNSEITERKSSLNPPFRYQAKLYAKYNSESSARRAANLVIGDLKKDLSLAGLQIIGPSPAFKERVAGKYQYQIIIKSPKRELLQQAILNHLPTTWNHDLDPLSLL